MEVMSDVIKVQTAEPGILHVSLNRKDQLNALNHELLQRLLRIFHDVKQDSSIKGILLTGEGKAFCAGADIKQLSQLNGQQGLTFARFGQTVFKHIEQVGKPTVAAIHGFAFGGGCELAMAATLRVAADTAVFGQPEIKLGVIPGFGGTQRLSRLVGKGRALELCLTGRRFSAEEAYHWGFINQLSTPDSLHERAMTLLQELVKLPPIALQSIMTVIDQGYNLSLEEALELEAAHFGLCCTTSDKQEGVSAFLEKRSAIFNGV